jgi:hypothetical protein
MTDETEDQPLELPDSSGFPSAEEVQAVMKESGWDEQKALQYLLIEAGNPAGTDAPDLEDDHAA